jgi:hypothetical protein
MEEYVERFPAASVALTRYLYVVAAARPVSLYEVPDGVAIWTKFEQLEPWHLSTRYPVTPALSVDAVQERLIWEEEIAVAERPVGTEGGVVSAVEVNVAVIVVFPVTVTVQEVVVTHPLAIALDGETDQFVKVDPDDAWAVNDTEVPLVTVVEQVAPQLIEPPVTVPDPVPVFWTVSGYVAGST